MKILVLYTYPPAPGGLATQGDLLYKGLLEIGVDAHAAHLKSDLEKEWYYRWFKPDVVVGIGFWILKPEYVRLLWTDPVGIKFFTYAICSEIVGILVIRKLANIKV